MYSVTDARTEATNSKCITRESGDIRTHTVNRSAKFNDNTQHCAIVIKFASQNGYLKFCKC